MVLPKCLTKRKKKRIQNSPTSILLDFIFFSFLYHIIISWHLSTNSAFSLSFYNSNISTAIVLLFLSIRLFFVLNESPSLFCPRQFSFHSFLCDKLYSRCYSISSSLFLVFFLLLFSACKMFIVASIPTTLKTNQ